MFVVISLIGLFVLGLIVVRSGLRRAERACLERKLELYRERIARVKERYDLVLDQASQVKNSLGSQAVSRLLELQNALNTQIQRLNQIELVLFSRDMAKIERIKGLIEQCVPDQSAAESDARVLAQWEIEINELLKALGADVCAAILNAGRLGLGSSETLRKAYLKLARADLAPSELTRIAA